MRPASIVQFERLFLAALALDVIAGALTWNAEVAWAVKAYPQFAGTIPALVSCMMLGVIAIGLAVWYFAARRASVAAKWVAAVWFVIGTILLALSLMHGISFALPALLGWLAYLLRVWSVSYLFKPDAEAWFASR